MEATFSAEGWLSVNTDLINTPLINTCQIHAVTALDFFQVIDHHLPLKPVFPTLILFIPECSSSSLHHSLPFPSSSPLSSQEYLFNYFPFLPYTSFCSSVQKQQSQKRASLGIFLHQKSFKCSLSIEIKLKVRVPGYSNAPILFLILFQQVNFEVLQYTHLQMINDNWASVLLAAWQNVLC